MQRIGLFALVLAFAALLTGCSEETRRKTDQALDHTGQAIESAAKDTANVTKGAVEGAKKAVEENNAK